MRLKHLYLEGVRNLEPQSVTGFSDVNVIHGPNGSGKTSCLEAVYLTGMARSFRPVASESLIQHGSTTCTVSAGVVPDDRAGTRETRLGVQRTRRGPVRLRQDGVTLPTLSRLAQVFPVLAIHSGTFQVLDGGPGQRRRFLDWGVFHVEHGFHEAWRALYRALKHRNALLRRGKINDAELAVWDTALAEAGEAVHGYREAYTRALEPVFQQVLSALASELPEIVMTYRAGWDTAQGLRERLLAARPRDWQRGFTGTGPHRADLGIMSHGAPAAEVLSRGQKKLVVLALRLAQSALLADRRGVYSVLLLDDLPSELDEEHLARVCRWLMDQRNQVFISCINPAGLPVAWRKQEAGVAWFHVEQGRMIAG